MEYIATKYISNPFVVKCLWACESADSVYMFFKLKDYTHLHAWAWGGKR